ncbi:MAG: hypothetical protein AAF919_09445 [Pseudomonadota bacterium]
MGWPARKGLNTVLAVSLVAVLAGCVGGGNDTVDTVSEIEATTDSDIDGDGTVIQGGVEVGG